MNQVLAAEHTENSEGATDACGRDWLLQLLLQSPAQCVRGSSGESVLGCNLSFPAEMEGEKVGRSL